MAGKFLPFARIGEKAINVVPTRGEQLVFDAPDFPQDKIAFGRLNRIDLQCFSSPKRLIARFESGFLQDHS